MAKRKESAEAANEKKLRRQLQQGEAAYLKAQQQVEVAQARVSKARGRLKRRASVVAKIRAGLVDLAARSATISAAVAETGLDKTPAASTSVVEAEASRGRAAVEASAPAAPPSLDAADDETGPGRPRGRRKSRTSADAAQPLVGLAREGSTDGEAPVEGEGALGLVVP